MLPIKNLDDRAAAEFVLEYLRGLLDDQQRDKVHDALVRAFHRGSIANPPTALLCPGLRKRLRDAYRRYLIELLGEEHETRFEAATTGFLGSDGMTDAELLLEISGNGSWVSATELYALCSFSRIRSAMREYGFVSTDSGFRTLKYLSGFLCKEEVDTVAFKKLVSQQREYFSNKEQHHG